MSQPPERGDVFLHTFYKGEDKDPEILRIWLKITQLVRMGVCLGAQDDSIKLLYSSSRTEGDSALGVETAVDLSQALCSGWLNVSSALGSTLLWPQKMKSFNNLFIVPPPSQYFFPGWPSGILSSIHSCSSMTTCQFPCYHPVRLGRINCFPPSRTRALTLFRRASLMCHTMYPRVETGHKPPDSPSGIYGNYGGKYTFSPWKEV